MRDPNPSGLGRAIINRRVKDARKAYESGLVRKKFFIAIFLFKSYFLVRY